MVRKRHGNERSGLNELDIRWESNLDEVAVQLFDQSRVLDDGEPSAPGVGYFDAPFIAGENIANDRSVVTV